MLGDSTCHRRHPIRMALAWGGRSEKAKDDGEEMRWEGKQVWMELKELREIRQEKSQDVAVLSGLEHTVMFRRAPASAAPSLSLSARVPLGLLSPAQRRKKMWSWEHRAGAGQGRRGEGSTSGAEFCRQRVKQLEHEDKPTSTAAGWSLAERPWLCSGSLCKKWPRAPGGI